MRFRNSHLEGLSQWAGDGYRTGFALVAGPNVYTLLHTRATGAADLPVVAVRGLLEDGPVYRSTVLPDDEALLLSVGAGRIDRAVAVEPSAEFLRIERAGGGRSFGCSGSSRCPSHVIRSERAQARPGQTVRLTVLMAAGGSAHATCGLLPRVSTALSREWIAPALKRLMPTFRVGPMLVDPAAVRVPKTTGLPKEQVFSARPDPASWRDDPISAATQDALLPTAPAVVREGYLRITLPDRNTP